MPCQASLVVECLHAACCGCRGGNWQALVPNVMSSAQTHQCSHCLDGQEQVIDPAVLMPRSPCSACVPVLHLLPAVCGTSTGTITSCPPMLS